MAAVMPGEGWAARRRGQLLLGLGPALLVLATLTVVPGIYLALTALTPLNLANPATAWNFKIRSETYAACWKTPAFYIQ